MRIGAIEAGGTKFICGIGNENGIIEDQISFPTEHPELTLPKVIQYFQDKPVEAIGIGSFGPIDVRPDSPTYGYVTTTPKPGWGNYDMLGTLKRNFWFPLAGTRTSMQRHLVKPNGAQPKGYPAVCTIQLAQVLVWECIQKANLFMVLCILKGVMFLQDAILKMNSQGDVPIMGTA